MANITPQPALKIRADNNTLFQFPCAFPLKVIGKATHDFELLVTQILQRHCPDWTNNIISTRTSRSSKYIALTVTITAHNRAQLDALYQELSEHEQIMMVL